MSILSRIAIAAAFVAGVGSFAEAQTRWEHPSTSSYDALVEGRSVQVDRAAPERAAVPPSTSGTVMGLRVPR